MNLELIDNFGQNHPEEYDGLVDCSSVALTCSFNRWGSMMAIGCNDGKIVIVDFITRGVAKVITTHVHPVCSLSWSRNGRKLMSCSTDNTVVIGNVQSSEPEKRYRFSTPVLTVQFHPRDENKFLVCPLKHAALIVDSNGTHKALPSDDGSGVDLNITASFDRRGQYIITGNGKGKLSIFDSQTLDQVKWFRLPSSHAIKLICFARKTDMFLTNSADRIIRVFDLNKIMKTNAYEPSQKLQDLVNKTPWKTCVFSGDSEYVCAGSAKQYALYIWERNSGNLVKILHGNKGETLLDLVWHPARPLVCSVANGTISVWSKSHVENWSAFAPDFKAADSGHIYLELDENVEYEERESEFDLEDEDKSVECNVDQPDIDEDVDVMTVEPNPLFCSSDEEGEDPNALLILSNAPEIDEPEESAVVEMPPPAQVESPTKQTRYPGNKGNGTTYNVELENVPADALHPLLPNPRKRNANSGGRSHSKQKRS